MKRKSNGARGGLLRALFTLVAVLATMAFPTVAYAKGTTIRVTSVSASPGDVVEVPVVVEGSPGILGATLEIAYDEGLTLAGATNGEALSSLAMTKPGSLKSPCKFTWDGVELADSDVRDGQVLLLSFKISDDAEPGKDLGVSVSGDAGSVLDGNLNAIDVTYESGVVSVANYIPGDLDGDKLVNSRDVIYARRHIVGGYEQTINVAAADVNDDLLVNSADVILMRRFITGGYGVELKRSRLSGGSGGGSEEPGPEPHKHTTEAIAAKNPTCTEDGNIAYWHCTGCDKYFSDEGCTAEIAIENTVIMAAGHTPVVDAAVAPTHTSTGLTEGSHCAVCGKVLKDQQIVPKLEADEYYITYDVANGDSYLAGLNITNPNKTSYYEGDSFKLTNLSVDGYLFLGWYDGAGDDANKVTRINADTAEDLELYAHWQAIQYQVQFKSDLFLDTKTAAYTVDKGLVLPTPKLSNYIFTGWSDESGKLFGISVPVGTTGNIILEANWTSERNKTYTNPHPKDPTIYEDEESNTIVFAYEIGRIENVPLYTIKDFGYIAGDGVTRKATETYSATTSESTAETIANVVANATTNSSNWTLSSGWNETTSISEEWCNQRGLTKQEAETKARSESNNWNVSNSSYGSNSSSTQSVDSKGWTCDTKVSASDTDTFQRGNKFAAEVHAEVKAGTKIPGAEVGVSIGGGISNETTSSSSASNTNGFESGRSEHETHDVISASSSTAGWNSASSRGGSATTSSSQTVSTTVSEVESMKKGYGKSYIYSGSETQGLAISTNTSQSDSYTAATTYNTATSKSVSNSWETASTKPGYHRWIVAGTAHVYGVVGYDMNTKSFFVYTYTIMDDETHEFEDYSNTTAAYNDHENGVISFEVPYDEVMETVVARTFDTDGLKVDLETGEIVGYTGTDSLVMIPEYYNAGDGDVVKITGITSDAFAGNTNIVDVVLSDFITEIPDGAFAGCTSLAYVNGAGVTSIGARAFAGCTNMEECGVYSKVTHLGEKAFDGAERVYVNAANPQVALASLESGAKSIQLNLRFLENSENVLSGKSLDVPDTVDYFELNGNERLFNGLKLTSNAKETVLNKITLSSDATLPVRMASERVTLNQSSISSPGIALALTADSTQLGLRGTTTISSTGPNAMLCRNVSLYETAGNVAGKLVVPQRLLVCGAIDGTSLLQCDKVETIDEATFNALLNTHKVYFDAGEGTCEETSRDLVYGEPIGELPVPVRDFYDFEGWYLKGDDKLVTADTVLPISQDLTLVARWKEQWTTEIPNGRYTLRVANDPCYSLDMSHVNVDSLMYDTAESTMYLWHTNYSVAQQFKFFLESDGSYKITRLNDNLVLESGKAAGSGVSDITMANDSSSEAQRWYIQKTNDGTFALRNKGNGKYVTVSSNAFSNNLPVLCTSWDEERCQSFSIQSVRFAIYDRGMSWRKAETICEQLGGHLATITTAAEQMQIEELLTSRATNSDSYKNYYWLGGYAENESWKWVTGEPFSYTNWGNGQPDGYPYTEENKLMIWRYQEDGNPKSAPMKWNDLNADVSVYGSFYNYDNCGFIIEWEDADSNLQAQNDGEVEPSYEQSQPAEQDNGTLDPTTIQEDSDVVPIDDEPIVIEQSDEALVSGQPDSDSVIVEVE